MKDRFEEDLIDQATRQVQAAGSREIEWHFAEKEAADAARELFGKTSGLERIKVVNDFWREGME